MPPRICSFESRRQTEMTSLIERFGGEATVVASMQEVPLDDNGDAFQFAAELLSGQFDVMLFLTGVGATALFEVLQTRHTAEELKAAFNCCQIMVRGPKPVPVLKDFGLRIDLRAPEPNTWREVLQELERAQVNLSGCRFAIQEYGAPSKELTAELTARGAIVRPVNVYRWALPDDIAPLEQAIRNVIAGQFNILLWTSAQQVNNVAEVADRLGLRDAWHAAASQCFIGSIGPTASERIREFGLPVSLEPSHPKMAHLVRESMEAWQQTQS